MLITGFPAGPLAANCYVLAGGITGDCIVVDPGQQAADPLRALLAEHGLRPAAVLLTHGHFDHVASAAAVCDEYGADVYLGGGDVAMLTDPLSALSKEFQAMLPQFLGPGESLDNLRPARLTPLAGGEHLSVAGLEIDALAVPGHTPGSMTYRVRASAESSGSDRGGADGQPDVLLTGDTLFAGTIGRTDLPGGSMPKILESIGGQLLSVPDDTVVLPGHGAATTIGAERAGNPFLAELR
jgi:glyoxylase-like metal-dependent hydrolase (beta-lactamase superfamily II)